MEAFFETAESRAVTIDGTTVEIVQKWCGFYSDDEAEVTQRALTESSPTYRGMVRGALRLMPQRGGVWFVEVPYRPLGPGQAVDASSAGLGPDGGGGDGGEEPTPTGPSIDGPLGPEYSFQLAANTVHITQSKNTVYARSALDGTAAGFGSAPSFNGAIGVTEDGVAGCDVVAPSAKMVVKVGRGRISMQYIDALLSLIGRTNQTKFYQRERGEVLYMGCTIGMNGGRWELSHEFGLSKNLTNVGIGNCPAVWQAATAYAVGDQVTGATASTSTYTCTQAGTSAGSGGPAGTGTAIADGGCLWDYAGPRGITLPAVGGWEYVWTRYQKDVVGSSVVPLPIYAYVEQVYSPGNFAGLGIGT